MPKTIKYRVYDAALIKNFDAYRATYLYTVGPEYWLGYPGQKIMVLVYPNSDQDIRFTTYSARMSDGLPLPSFI